MRGSQARYFISCPGCDEFQELGWSLLRFDDVTYALLELRLVLRPRHLAISAGGMAGESSVIRIHKSFPCSALISPLMRWEVLIDEYQNRDPSRWKRATPV